MKSMKIGMIISALVVLLFAGLFFVTWVGETDPATAATSADKLALVTLPGDLPPLRVAGDSKADATSDYQEAFEAYRSVKNQLQRPPFSQSAIGPIVDAVNRAANAGQVSKGFADDWVKFDYSSASAAASPFFEIGQTLLQHAYQLAGEDEAAKADAKVIADSVFVMGRRGFEANTKLSTRYSGLLLMEAAGQMLFDFKNEANRDDSAWAWGTAVAEVRDHWEPKVQIVRSPKPGVGDLIRIAQYDGDRTFRIAATYWLGVARFTAAGSRGNMRAIETALQSARASEDQLVREATEAASALTVEQFRKLR